MGVQLTPGQRYLLDILQKKLIGTLQTYARKSRERRDLLQKLNEQQGYLVNEDELARLREKIKRISARQKRFTSEIINGNGNNTIPKESFFKALGLVTRETLNQINSKSSERRRRTTANPRFSHEAIQAKKALQKPRIEPKVTREKRIPVTAATNPSPANSIPAGAITTTSTAATTRQRNHNNNNQHSNGNQNNNGTSRGGNNYNNSLQEQPALSIQEGRKLVEEFLSLYEQIESKAGQIKVMLENRKRLDEEKSELMDLLKKHPIELSALKDKHMSEYECDDRIALYARMILPNLVKFRSLAEAEEAAAAAAVSASASSSSSRVESSSSSTSTSPQPAARSREEELLASQALASLIDQRVPAATLDPQQPVETWLKCNESIEGLE